MKKIIGMIHLKALPTAPKNEDTVNEIYTYALKDLKTLEDNGYNFAIVENMFDYPYTKRLDLDTIVSYTKIFTLLKNQTNMKLGVNLHNTESDEELVIAHYCDADFIRIENMVELRFSEAGILNPLAPDILRTKKRLKSKVKIFADFNVKETVPIVSQDAKEVILQLEKYEVDGIIVSGISTGRAPSVSDVKELRKLINCPLFIGSGVDENNISGHLKYADGVIVGSSIKENGIVSSPISGEKAKDLIVKAE